MIWRLLILMAIFSGMVHVVYGGELTPPLPRKDRPTADELYLRQIHREWNNDVVTTTNPNGAIRCKQIGDHLLYDNSGSFKQCFCTSPPTTWRCDASALTAP